MQRKIVVFLSDTHAGSNVALMPPGLTLHDEGPNGELIPYSPEQTASQVYLWDLYQGYIQRVMEIAGRDDVIVLHVGDVCQGNKYPVGLVTTRMADQILIGASNLSEWLKHPQVFQPTPSCRGRLQTMLLLYKDTPYVGVFFDSLFNY